MESFVSDLSGKSFLINERVFAKAIQLPVMSIIKSHHPNFSEQSICALEELNIYRQEYITEYLERDVGELTSLESTVLETLKNRDSISSKLCEPDENLTLSQRMADRIASFGGSWKFILTFFSFLICWIILNAVWYSNKSFDPYPFILLNLILSCVAALQAPLIMMSQNRQEEKDRERSKKDYMINLKSEIEIRTLHEKIDHLMMHQQHELIQIQKLQIDMMQDILERVNAPANHASLNSE
ncbi:MAG: DUF1003 domain-containing protein [Chryseolinea sp.]